MKRKRAHIISTLILGAALLFNQIGLPFFHDAHDAHQFFPASQKDQTILLNHGEHCQVCSLEVLFNIVLPATTGIPVATVVRDYEESLLPNPVVVFTALSQGRAPPLVA